MKYTPYASLFWYSVRLGSRCGKSVQRLSVEVFVERFVKIVVVVLSIELPISLIKKRGVAMQSLNIKVNRIFCVKGRVFIIWCICDSSWVYMFGRCLVELDLDFVFAAFRWLVCVSESSAFVVSVVVLLHHKMPFLH
jgi:hypothetical protein